MKITLPSALEPLISNLLSHNIRPILVGGYLRDILMHNSKSKDIDIELYGVDSMQGLIEILRPFANPHEVGKSFGVIKLDFEGYDIDFSLPRTENKTTSGHRGFEVQTYHDISFKKAAIRRDFTINAIGYDFLNQKLLDPFNGEYDVKNKILSCVNSETFVEDPLRLFRALGFCARFELTCKSELISLCHSMYGNGSLHSLAKERIFEELKKLLLRSKKPSIGFKLLQNMQCLSFFPELATLCDNEMQTSLKILDNLAQSQIDDEKLKLCLLFVVLVSNFKTQDDVTKFIYSLSEDKKFLKKVVALYSAYKKLASFVLSDSNIRRLALHVRIDELALLTKIDFKNKKLGEKLLKRSYDLHVSHKAPVALLQGRDLIRLGVNPSKRFSEILALAFEAQLDGEFNTLKEAKVWLKTKLLNYQSQ